MGKNKIGPNNPCPCGSGKKYKKCCFMKDGKPSRPAGQQTTAPDRPKSFEEIGAQYDISPYHVAREAAEDHFGVAGRGRPEPWSIQRLATLSTDDILIRIASLGIEITQATFLEASCDERSAWKLSRRWRGQIPQERAEDHNFVALAVCELWKRWSPERPSMEMIDDLIHEGYECLEEGEEREAYQNWWQAWQILRAWVTPEMRTFTAAERAFQGSQFMFNWLQDFSMYWSNFAQDAPTEARRGITFIRECLSQFRDEKPELQRSLRMSLAGLHFALGEFSEGRALVDDEIAKNPRACEPYAVLSDELAHRATTPEELDEAIEVLLRAQAAKVVDDVDYDLDRRLKYLGDQMRKMREGKAPPASEANG